MSAEIYLEGGGDSREGRIRCREGFRKLLEKCGFSGRMPGLVACGSRESAYADFTRAHARPGVAGADYVGLLIDSEEPVANIDETWSHLRNRDDWERPAGAGNDQALLMTTCMETWLVSDRHALASHFGQHLQAAALPALDNVEERARGEVQQSLRHATRNCPGPYAKGPTSFRVLAALDPDTMARHLPSFARVRRILANRLPQAPRRAAQARGRRRIRVR